MADSKPGLAITAAEFFAADRLAADATLGGAELHKAFWRLKGMLTEKARQERFWAATNEALAQANQELAERSQELKAAREQLLALNQELELRVAAQVEEIVSRSREIAQLNLQLQIKVQERSRELAIALAKLAQREECDFKAGDVLDARVRIAHQIGRGGMGQVYRAEDLLTGQEVAVKIMRPESVGSPIELRRFIEEARNAAVISHPAIVRTLHLDVTPDGAAYQIMEYVRGVDLGQYLDQRVLAPGPAVRIAAALADVLASAHERGLIHRDVKPSNILLSWDEPGMRLLDFGLSKVVAFDAGLAPPLADSESVPMTLAGQIMGTPHYLSPEQIRDSRNITAAIDVYSLGATLFHMLAGKPPFFAQDMMSICVAHLSERAPDLRLWMPIIPDTLAELVIRCMAKSAAERPSARQLASELTALADALQAPNTASCALQALKSLTRLNDTEPPPV